MKAKKKETMHHMNKKHEMEDGKKCAMKKLPKKAARGK